MNRLPIDPSTNLRALVALFGVLLFSAACSLGTELEHEGDIQYRTLQVEGEERSFVLYLPKGVEPSGAGLILAFHGWGMSGITFQRGTDLDRVAREVGAVIAYPDAPGTHWAEDCDCVPADASHLVADTAFASALLDDLTTEFNLDPNRRYAVGFSQGGLFAMRLACQMTDRFDVVVEVASVMASALAERCEPSGPISILTILSQRDGSFPWEGVQDGAFADLGAEGTVAFWGEANGCSPDPQRIEEGGVLRLRFTGCDGGSRVELIGPEDGEHSWAVSPGINTRKEIVAFLTG